MQTVPKVRHLHHRTRVGRNEPPEEKSGGSVFDAYLSLPWRRVAAKKYTAHGASMAERVAPVHWGSGAPGPPQRGGWQTRRGRRCD